jgi:trehalose 6-phosphate synthase
MVDTPSDTLTDMSADGYVIKTFDLTQAEHEDYYLGYANSVLWPLCHRRTDLMALSEGYFESYRGVNERLARMLAGQVGPDDLIWVHDYHFLPLAKCLRDLGVTARIGYFHHIPFPAPTDLAALPQAEAFFKWISNYDLVGLQTQADVATAFDLFRRHDEGEQLMNGRLRFQGRDFATRSFPIGIDATAFQTAAQSGDGRKMLKLGPEEKLVIGVDRLDYSKGLNNRLQAFGAFLDARADDAPQCSMLQVAPPTREDVLD